MFAHHPGATRTRRREGGVRHDERAAHLGTTTAARSSHPLLRSQLRGHDTNAVQICGGGLREAGWRAEVGFVLLRGPRVVSLTFWLRYFCRYFDDSVRDDYAAGQLDAQVRAPLHRKARPWPLILMWLGREYSTGDAGAHYLRRQLNGPSQECSIHDITVLLVPFISSSSIPSCFRRRCHHRTCCQERYPAPIPSNIDCFGSLPVRTCYNKCYDQTICVIPQQRAA